RSVWIARLQALKHPAVGMPAGAGQCLARRREQGDRVLRYPLFPLPTDERIAEDPGPPIRGCLPIGKNQNWSEAGGEPEVVPLLRQPLLPVIAEELAVASHTAIRLHGQDRVGDRIALEHFADHEIGSGLAVE